MQRAYSMIFEGWQHFLCVCVSDENFPKNVSN